jgi:hypothetical protein
MNRHTICNLGVVIAVGLALLPNSATSQQRSLKEQLIGSWAIVSNDNVAPDGTKRQIFGPNPKGLFVFDADGRYVLVVVNPDRPKFKGASRLDGTPEENKAAIAGTVASFGTWSLEEATNTLVTKAEGDLFPNAEGSGPTAHHRVGGRRTQNGQSISGFRRASRNRVQTREIELSLWVILDRVSL